MTTRTATPQAPVWTPFIAQPEFSIGQRVRVTCGGYSGECGRVRDIRHGRDGGPTVIVTLDTAMLFYGSARCLEVLA